MKVPQYKVNVHVAEFLSRMGLSVRAEEVYKTPVRGVRIPDFTLLHPLVGPMLGEAEVGESEYDPRAMERLKRRVEERFGDVLFKGYDFILLIIYRIGDLERLAGLEERRVGDVIGGVNVGVGLAVRGDVFELGGHYINYYGVPVEVKGIPVVLDKLVLEFYSHLERISPQVRVRVKDLVEGLESIINTYASNLARSVTGKEDLEGRLRDVALALSIAWDRIADPVKRLEVTFKLILLLETLIIMFYELSRRERYQTLKAPQCNNMTYEGFLELIRELLGVPGGRYSYVELDSELLRLLGGVPSTTLLDHATVKICREVVNGYPLLRRMGWDILSAMYQRMLSETYRHAFATFYTKIPAAGLLATLSIERFEDKVIDPACGTGSLLLSSLERRLALLTGGSLESMLEEAGKRRAPLLDLARERVLERTVGLDALRPAVLITALNLRIATHISPPETLNLYNVPVGERRAGSLDLLTEMAILMPTPLRKHVDEGFDVVLMNPPFTRSDRIPTLIGEGARGMLREAIRKRRLSFGSTPVKSVFEAGLAKPFMVLADRLVKEGGRIAAVLPTSILSRPAWRDVREGLVKGYRVEYLAVSWAPGTPNFSSDTEFREVLLVARKKGGGRSTGKMKVIGLLKKVDELSYGEVELLAREAMRVEEGYSIVISGGSAIGYVSVLEEGLVERFHDNLYRLIAFRRPELLRFHLEVISGNSVRLGELFEVGSVIDHTTGLHVTRRDERVSAIHEQPALWGSGDKLGIKTVMVDRAPWKVGVVRESDVRVKYWSPRQTFYTANLFVLRRGQLDTQYVLAVNVGEASVSNEWWPLRVKAEQGDPHLVERFLVYMNSMFGFLHLLGERLETRGLWVEYKKQHVSEVLLPDLRLTPPPSSDVLEALRKPMPRFKEYLEATARLSERSGKPWYEVAEELVKGEGGLSTRARLDLEVYRWLREVFKVEPPVNLYAILRDEVVVLKKVMEGGGGGEVIEDEVEGGSTERHASLDRWF